MTFEATVDPARHEINHESTGVYVRAKYKEKWGSFDIAELDRDSLFRFLRSRGGANLWAENVVLVMLGHEAYFR